MRSALSWVVLVRSRQTGQESLCEELGHGWLTHVAPPHFLDNRLEDTRGELEHQARANALAQSSMPVSFNRTLNLSLLPATIRAFRVTSDSLRLVYTFPFLVRREIGHIACWESQNLRLKGLLFLLSSSSGKAGSGLEPVSGTFPRLLLFFISRSELVKVTHCSVSACNYDNQNKQRSGQMHNLFLNRQGQRGQQMFPTVYRISDALQKLSSALGSLLCECQVPPLSPWAIESSWAVGEQDQASSGPGLIGDMCNHFYSPASHPPS